MHSWSLLMSKDCRDGLLIRVTPYRLQRYGDLFWFKQMTCIPAFVCTSVLIWGHIVAKINAPWTKIAWIPHEADFNSHAKHSRWKNGMIDVKWSVFYGTVGNHLAIWCYIHGGREYCRGRSMAWPLALWIQLHKWANIWSVKCKHQSVYDLLYFETR